MIYGKNVVLRTVYPHEVEHIYELVTNINSKGRFWHLSFPSSSEFISEFNKNGFWSMEEGRMLILSHQGDYVGELLYFKGLDYQSGYEVGYELFNPQYQGQGFMSEALLLFCAYMFSVRPINRIQVNMMEGNTASARVAEKCGFSYEGTMRKATFNQGEYHNLKLYSILREECPSLDSLLI